MLSVVPAFAAWLGLAFGATCEERGHAPVLFLLPLRERMVVALGTLKLDTQKRPADRVRHLVHGVVGSQKVTAPFSSTGPV
jgi:hypothetical protein